MKTCHAIMVASNRFFGPCDRVMWSNMGTARWLCTMGRQRRGKVRLWMCPGTPVLRAHDLSRLSVPIDEGRRIGEGASDIRHGFDGRDLRAGPYVQDLMVGNSAVESGDRAVQGLWSVHLPEPDEDEDEDEPAPSVR